MMINYDKVPENIQKSDKHLTNRAGKNRQTFAVFLFVGAEDFSIAIIKKKWELPILEAELPPPI